MWAEPLTVSTRRTDTHTVAVTVHDAAGVPVAAVLCAHNARAGFGAFGEMRVLDDRGGPKQTRRALVLLVREALRYADALGITRVRTEAPERLEPFASRMCGLSAERAGNRRLYEGELHAARTVALSVSGDDGSLRALTPEEEALLERTIDGAIDLRG